MRRARHLNGYTKAHKTAQGRGWVFCPCSELTPTQAEVA